MRKFLLDREEKQPRHRGTAEGRGDRISRWKKGSKAKTMTVTSVREEEKRGEIREFFKLGEGRLSNNISKHRSKSHQGKKEKTRRAKKEGRTAIPSMEWGNEL